MEACCTCATLLSQAPRFAESEKPLPSDRRLSCCIRTICGSCIHKNARFRSYCPYCQISSASPSPLPPGLKDPPSYDATVGSSAISPPPYTPLPTNITTTPAIPTSSPAPPSDPEKAALTEAFSSDDNGAAEDILHFLNHDHDTISSLSLRYNVPAGALRRANNLGSDHLLAGRRTILIPGRFYKGGVSLSPRPVEGEEEEARKAKIRRFMVTCKVFDYDSAVFYLSQADYSFHDAIDNYFADEAWERDHPLEHNVKGKGRARRRV